MSNSQEAEKTIDAFAALDANQTEPEASTHRSQLANGQTVVSIDASGGYPRGFKLFIVMFALCLAVFCVALDNTIVATAIPHITDDFHALQDIGWYGSAYLLTTCAFQLFYGKLYVLFSIKCIFLIALAIFEIGSLVCATAPSSTALIIGRAVAGLGSAGLFSGALVIIAHSTPVVNRPVFTGTAGMMYGVASVLGPLIGGAFTSHVTWRWCFYINLPLGGVTAAIVIFFLHMKKTRVQTQASGLLAIIWSLDPIGTVLFVASTICLLLALQLGGSSYSWDDGRIVALMIIFVFALVAFIAIQIWLGESATVPIRIFTQRSIAFASLFAFMLGAAFFIFLYFIPVWFQAVDGVDAFVSGIHTIPLVLTMTIAIIISGGFTTKFGQYMPWVWASTVLSSIGAGLIYTWNPHTEIGKWIGYEIVFGFGCGLAFQLPQIAAQAVLELEDVAIGVAITFFAEIFGGAVFVSAGNNILNNHLIDNIGALHIPEIDPAEVVRLGATQLRNDVPSQYLPAVVQAYNSALDKTFEMALIVSCLTAIGAIGMEWRSVKGHEPELVPS